MKFENEKSIYQLKIDDGKFFISRTVKKTGVTAIFSHYTLLDREGNSIVKRINKDIGKAIIKEASKDDNLSSALVVIEGPSEKVKMNFSDKTKMENLYTSTGEKFLHHKESIESYKKGEGKSIISTHISPEGRCNLRCPYCSVAYRMTFSRIEFDTIKRYLDILRERGLKAVILTGGGEPTLYPHINELIELIHDKYGLELAMISNGTSLDRVHPSNRHKFQWLRVSINIFKGWEEKIKIPVEFQQSNAVIGFSYIFTCEHNFIEEEIEQKEIIFRIINMMDKYNAKYLRILPNCLLKGSKFNYEHRAIAKVMSFFNDSRIFHQLKTHEIPEFGRCFQSYFRPYLSEERNPWNGKPGSVFPCDSVVLNDSSKKFEEKFALSEPERIGDYLDGNIKIGFLTPASIVMDVFLSIITNYFPG